MLICTNNHVPKTLLKYLFCATLTVFCIIVKSNESFVQKPVGLASNAFMLLLLSLLAKGIKLDSN